MKYYKTVMRLHSGRLMSTSYFNIPSVYTVEYRPNIKARAVKGTRLFVHWTESEIIPAFYAASIEQFGFPYEIWECDVDDPVEQPTALNISLVGAFREIEGFWAGTYRGHILRTNESTYSCTAVTLRKRVHVHNGELAE